MDGFSPDDPALWRQASLKLGCLCTGFFKLSDKA